jgi:hypothetical protein
MPSMLPVLDAAKKLIPAELRTRLKRVETIQQIYDRAVISRNFRRHWGRGPNLRNPTTFNEKVVFKMLYDRRPLLTRIADKVQARGYVAETIGPQYLTQVYQICDSVQEIDWPRLPERFVIKANHGAGMNIFVPDKSRIDLAWIASRFATWLGRNYYSFWREWAYRDIRPQILIEELLLGERSQAAIDWKFYVFDGRAEFFHATMNRFSDPRANFYDRQRGRLNLWYGYPNADEDPPFPENFEEMVARAETLAGGLDFVRVDLYNIGGRIVFGELTNYPSAGMGPFHPAEFDLRFGAEWRWPPRYG